MEFNDIFNQFSEQDHAAYNKRVGLIHATLERFAGYMENQPTSKAELVILQQKVTNAYVVFEYAIKNDKVEFRAHPEMRGQLDSQLAAAAKVLRAYAEVLDVKINSLH